MASGTLVEAGRGGTLRLTVASRIGGSPYFAGAGSLFLLRMDGLIVLPRLRGRIQEGAGHSLGVGAFQIRMISCPERSSLRLSPSLVLPRMTGEEIERS